jgi:GNAT superfamily N-acetyltransferase
MIKSNNRYSFNIFAPVMLYIRPFQSKDQKAVIDLILNIQQREFNVPVTLQDQPDLLQIEQFYQVNRGNFWVAVTPNDEVVGSIALIDNGDTTATIRKMFVKAEYRGKLYGTGQKLYDLLESWAIDHGFQSLWLGTFDRLHAALRFYDKNGFVSVDKRQLPPSFPIMSVDNRFYTKSLPYFSIRAAKLTDIAGVLALQSLYLFANLSEQEREQGFVTTPFTTEQITRVIQEEAGLYIAVQGESVIGYAFGASWDFWSEWPIFNYMVERFSQFTFDNQVFTTLNSYQYGPICVDISMRGKGVAEALFGAVKTAMSKRYALGLTFINRVNAISIAFHTRKLGLAIVDEFEFKDKQYFGLAWHSDPNV